MTATLARPAEVGTASRRRRAGTSAVAILLLVLGLLGIAVGAKPILVLTGKGERTQANETLPEGTLVFPDLAAAVEHVLKS